MTNQQEYDIFMAKLADKVRELRDDYSELSEVNQRRFDQMCQTICAANGVLIASEIVQRMLKGDCWNNP
jgi:hypothetical protein